MKILITGAGGFVGKNLMATLENIQSGKAAHALGCRRTHPGADVGSRRKSRSVFLPLLPQLPHGLAAVAAVAQALQQARRELHHVAPVGFDVVNVCGSDPKAALAALPAERLLQQLSGAAFRPVIPGIRVQVMPGS